MAVSLTYLLSTFKGLIKVCQNGVIIVITLHGVFYRRPLIYLLYSTLRFSLFDSIELSLCYMCFFRMLAPSHSIFHFPPLSFPISQKLCLLRSSVTSARYSKHSPPSSASLLPYFSLPSQTPCLSLLFLGPAPIGKFRHTHTLTPSHILAPTTHMHSFFLHPVTRFAFYFLFDVL